MDLENIKNSINKSNIDIGNLEKEIIIKKKQEALKEVIQTLFDRVQNEDNKLSNLGEQLQKLKSPYVSQVQPLSKKVDIIYREIQELDHQIELLAVKIQNLYLLPLFINFESN